MTDDAPQNTEAEQGSAQATPAQQQAQDEKTFTQAELERVIGERLAREREKFSDYSELKKRSAELAEIEEKNKTVEEKRQEELAAARWELESKAAELNRYRAANKFGIDEENMALIVGDDEEAMMASAERIGKLLADSRRLAEIQQTSEQKTQHSTGRPVDNLRPGATPVEQKIDELDYPSEWFPGHRQ